MAMPAGRIPWGPYPRPDEPQSLPLTDVLSFEDRTDSITGMRLDGAEIVGLLEPFNGRARAALIALLRGASRTQAAVAAGIDIDTMRGWERKHEQFATATATCANWGFATVFERELMSRALAGADDRGSMRALELIIKARDASYREKQQIQMEHIIRARAAQDTLVAGWQAYDAEVLPAPALEPGDLHGTV